MFDFSLKKEYLKTGTCNVAHFKVIKSGNVIHLVDNVNITQCTNVSDLNNNKFDEKMLKMAKKLNREIIVDEIDNGVVYLTNIYKPSGIKESINKISENPNFKVLQNNISKIGNDNSKIEFMNLAYNSLTNRKSLEELKLLIKGIELTLKD